MHTVIDIADSDDENLAAVSASSKPPRTEKIKDGPNGDTPAVISATQNPNGTKIKEEPDEDKPVVLSATNKPNRVKVENEDKPVIVSATNKPEKPSKPRVKKEEDSPDDAAKNGTSLTGFVDQNIFEDVDGDGDESGEEIVDSTYVGIAHINGVQHFVCEGFKIRQIPEPFVVKRSLRDLNACIINNSIILDPDYQRDVVWEEGRASMLITSILMGYFIPPIIFNVKKSTQEQEEGRNGNHIKWVRTCVDGKQRLTSVWKFMTGKIGFFDTSNPQRKWYFCQKLEEGRTVVDPTRNILPQPVKDFFESRYFCCYEYDNLDLDTEETMFQLVQRGIALSSAEKMRAMSTEWANYTKRYEEDYEVVMNLSKHSRASGFRLVLTIFTMIQEVTPFIGVKRKKNNPKPGPILRASPTFLTRALEDKEPIEEGIKARYKTIFDRYESLVKLCSEHITRTRWRVLRHTVFDPNPPFLYQDDTIKQTKTFSPLEFVVVAILIAVHLDNRTDDELLSDIGAFRTFLRKHHKDLRVNAQCWATSWDFISLEMDKRIKNPRLVEPAPEGIQANADPLRPKKKSLFSRAAEHRNRRVPRSRAGSSSSLSSVPSDLLEEFDDEEMEDEGATNQLRKKNKRNRKEKDKEKRKASSRERERGSEEMNERRSSKRAKQTSETAVDYSAEFPNLDL